MLCLYDTLAKGGGGRSKQALYNFWGEDLQYCYIMLHGGGVSKMDIFLLYNMWTTPNT